MLKLILPLTTKDMNSDRKDVEPLALLVHPQQPLSYLERLIQAELPTLKDKNGNERIPSVYFRAEDSMQDSMEAGSETAAEEQDDGGSSSESSPEKGKKKDEEAFEKPDEFRFDGKVEKTGKLASPSASASTPASSDRKTRSEAASLRGGHGQGGVESYSGLGHEGGSSASDSGSPPRRFVRWSSSTEIGDFIRDAARGQEFAVEIEGAPSDVRVGVPSFNDRTYYLRMRLRKMSKEIAGMAELKRECDRIAHKGARRVAMGGFGVLLTYWYTVYRLTFETDLGWDVMEPVTVRVFLVLLFSRSIFPSPDSLHFTSFLPFLPLSLSRLHPPISPTPY